MTSQQAEQFYDANAEYEWRRLERHPHEFAVNLRMLAEYLPAPPCRVLDIGGGPGRYSIALARQGYRTTLFDLSASCLAYAQQRAAEAGVSLEGAIHGNALDLGMLSEAHFDAVLLMGPMYHLLEAGDRSRALQEARRVLRPGGTLAVAFINRLARVRRADPAWTAAHLDAIRHELATGSRRDFDGMWTDAYTIHPTEVRPLLEQHGFTFTQLVASEAMREDDAPVALAGADLERWFDLQYELAKDPTIQGAAIHLFAVARKNASK